MTDTESRSAPDPRQDPRFQEIVRKIGDDLKEGAPPENIVASLVADGMAENEARKLVRATDRELRGPLVSRRRARQSSESGESGWLVWIGLLLLINLLSWIFDWPFWIY